MIKIKNKHKQIIHKLFNFSILLKGLDGILEILGGLVLFFVSSDNLIGVIKLLFHTELIEDSKDVVINYLISLFQNLSLNAQLFASIYLLIHGLIKIWLISSLLKKRVWAYPVSQIVLGIFVIYQIYRYTYTHSLFLVLLTLFDVLVISLIGFEWREFKKKKLF